MPNGIRYYWWHAEDLVLFAFNFLRHCFLLGAENVCVEFHPYEEYEGSQGVLRIVNALTGEVLGEYNFVHTCPPSCPKNGNGG